MGIQQQTRQGSQHMFTTICICFLSPARALPQPHPPKNNDSVVLQSHQSQVHLFCKNHFCMRYSQICEDEPRVYKGYRDNVSNYAYISYVWNDPKICHTVTPEKKKHTHTQFWQSLTISNWTSLNLSDIMAVLHLALPLVTRHETLENVDIPKAPSTKGT